MKKPDSIDIQNTTPNDGRNSFSLAYGIFAQTDQGMGV